MGIVLARMGLMGVEKYRANTLLLEALGDSEEARSRFEELIRRYPDDALVSSARWMLDHPGEALPDGEKPSIIK